MTTEPTPLRDDSEEFDRFVKEQAGATYAPFLQNGQVGVDAQQLLAAYGGTRVEADLAKQEIVRLEGLVEQLRAALRRLSEALAF
mgnify:CR=1 FL=1